MATKPQKARPRVRRDARLGDPEVARAWARTMTFQPAPVTVPQLIAKAIDGDGGAHWLLLEEYANRIDAPATIPKELAAYVWSVLRELVRKRSIDGMHGKPGKRPRKASKALRDTAILAMLDAAELNRWPLTRGGKNSAYAVVLTELKRRGIHVAQSTVETLDKNR